MNRGINKNGKLLSGIAAVLMLAALVIGCKTNISTPETFAVTFGVDRGQGSVKAQADGIAETDKGSILVAKGKTVTFTAVPADGYEVEKWTVDGIPVANNATETYTHAVTAKAEVSVVFKALSTPPVAVTEVTLKTALTLEEGKSEKLTATVSPANATNKKVTWNSDKPEVAEVSQEGTVTAKTVGTAKITVKTEDGSKTAECTVTVTVSKYQISFDVDGGHGTLKAEVDGTDIHTGDKVERGKTVIFTATANEGYEADKWTLSRGSFESGTGTVYNNTAKVTVTTAIDVKVTFKPKDKTYPVGSVSFTMKGIAAVTNGSVGHTERDNNKPHTVSLSAYLIGETEVTQELWQAVMDNNPSNFKDSMKNPVERVNWYECIAFCNELTKKVYGTDTECIYTVEGHAYGTADATAKKTPVMDMNKKGFRLPTEAEWGWAAKGGVEHRWAGTDDESKLGTYAWYGENSGNKTNEVKKKEANGYGLYDMSGNVWEWCWDWYGSLPDPMEEDYTGAGSGDYRVLRGGSWLNFADNAARAYRVDDFPDYRSDDLGLRLVSRP